MATKAGIAQNDYRLRKVTIALSLVVLVAAVGCAANYGRLVRNQEINEVFKTYRILPGHRYYFTGPEGRPDAIMGIRRDYTLETSMWTEFAPSGDTLKKWVDTINFHYHSQVQRDPYGFSILDSDGKPIGIWYSIWDWTTVLVEPDKRVKIFPPATEEPLGNGGGRRRKRF